MTVFDSQTGKKIQIFAKNLLHPVKVAFLRPQKIVILGNILYRYYKVLCYIIIFSKNYMYVMLYHYFFQKFYGFIDKWDESLKIVDLEKDNLSYCIDTKSKSYGRFRSPNGLVYYDNNYFY